MGMVLSFSDFTKGPTDNTVVEVGAHWQSLRHGGGLPKRSDIDPKAIGPHLDRVFLLERIGAGHARFRLSGNVLNDILSMDLRGMPLTSLFEPTSRSAIRSHLEECFQRPAVVTLDLKSGWTGTKAGRYQMHLWPMLSDLGDASRILGCLTSKGSPEATKRFHIEGVSARSVMGGSDLRTPDTEKPAPEGAGLEVISENAETRPD